jgi:putative phage-type endonuclease
MSHSSNSCNQRSRPFGIGGSEVAAVLGLSPYKSTLELWCDLVGRSTTTDQSLLHLRFGQHAESFIAKEYELRTGLSTKEHKQPLFHPEFDFMYGHIDRFVCADAEAVCVVNGKVVTDRLLECKTASVFNRLEWGEDGSKEVPAAYLLQCIWYMAITGCETADMAALIGNNDFRLYTIQRDRELEQLVVSHVKTFWFDHVLKKSPPPPSNVLDAQLLYPKEMTDSIVEANENVVGSLKEFVEISNQIKTLTTECDRIKSEILSYMGQSEKLTFAGKTLATWKSSKSSQRIDTKTLASDYPDIASKYTQTVIGSRRFLVKGVA